MSLHVFPGYFFFILDSRFAIFLLERDCPFGFLFVFFFNCGGVALSVSFFPLGVLDGRC